MSSTHFTVRKSTLDKRWDAFYSEPEIVALEQRVQQKATHTLRDFARFMSGGATPLKSEGDQHYTDAANGVPFIRVQNLTTTGELDLQDVKHITHSTNNSSLARSRLSGGELLVKITGVGHMAVASVVPDGLEANINQHIAAITTDSKAQSEALAAYLNLDFVERLASRRATGGTRPALDYNALLSIPIIDDPRIVSIMQVAYAEKKQLEAQASALLSSIDDFLLAELGITLPIEPENTIANRIFTVKRRELEQRFDPAFFSLRFSQIQHALEAIPHGRLQEVVLFSSEQWDQVSGFGDEFPYLEISAINTETGEVKGIDSISKKNAPSRAKMFIREGDLLVSTTRPNRGAITLVGADLQTPLIASTGFSIIGHVDESKISKEFLLILLRSRLCLMQFEQRTSGGNYPAITQHELGRVLLPSVAPCMQTKIIAHVKIVKAEAKHLRQQAEAKLESAKQAIEKLILGEA